MTLLSSPSVISITPITPITSEPRAELLRDGHILHTDDDALRVDFQVAALHE